MKLVQINNNDNYIGLQEIIYFHRIILKSNEWTITVILYVSFYVAGGERASDASNGKR